MGPYVDREHWIWEVSGRPIVMSTASLQITFCAQPCLSAKQVLPTFPVLCLP